jgi:hypothetical protein
VTRAREDKDGGPQTDDGRGKDHGRRTADGQEAGPLTTDRRRQKVRTDDGGRLYQGRVRVSPESGESVLEAFHGHGHGKRTRGDLTREACSWLVIVEVREAWSWLVESNGGRRSSGRYLE